MIHSTPTTALEDQQDSTLPAMAAALVPIHSIAWKTAQHFSYGARGFMRVPVSEANDLNYLLGPSWTLDNSLSLRAFSPFGFRSKTLGAQVYATTVAAS